ncbi:catalase [Roseococcus sp. SYP-B2431]|uniref:catalase family protein n=1 Tax=Roseococcus sp. SYP-B2431 TaxID=2496640 RepID=UPI00104018F9|nr:catalase family protein [Roseococcus sp. SYP-B2431]TCH98143.1 catalase [Roseococcus sp. SYP-B2431]
MTLPPLLYRHDLEQVSDDEPQVVDDLNGAFDRILETTHGDYGHAVRAVHAKAHGIMAGTFSIDAGLPPELAQGLFASPGEHPAWLRISTNPGDILDDAIALPRGLALKVGGVSGERLPGAEGTTQDFVMINSPAFIMSTAKTFAGNLKLLARTTDKAEGAKIALSKVLQIVNGALGKVGLESSKLASLGGAPQANPLGETYFSAVPFRYGDYVAKFRLRPVSPGLTDLTGRDIDTKGRPNAIRETIRQEMARIEGEWAFEVQLAWDEEKQPVEDASTLWDEAEAPFARVAALRVSAQDSWDPNLVEKVNETMRFSPWTGLAAHRPLGNVNRARQATYRHAADFRQAANRCPIHEP